MKKGRREVKKGGKKREKRAPLLEWLLVLLSTKGQRQTEDERDKREREENEGLKLRQSNDLLKLRRAFKSFDSAIWRNRIY